MRHIIPISGKDSLATAILQKQLQPEIAYEYMFNDTGIEFPETLIWLRKVEQQLGIEIKRSTSNLKEIVEESKFLPSHRARYCTRKAKIKPMEAMIGDSDAVVYYGLRFDEPKRKGYVGGNIDAKYPLREQKKDINDVYQIIKSSNHQISNLQLFFGKNFTAKFLNGLWVEMIF